MGVAFSLPQPLPGPGFLGMFQKLWRVTVTVVRSGGRDAKGNPTPSFELTLPDCLIAPRGTASAVDRGLVVVGLEEQDLRLVLGDVDDFLRFDDPAEQRDVQRAQGRDVLESWHGVS